MAEQLLPSADLHDGVMDRMDLGLDGSRPDYRQSSTAGTLLQRLRRDRNRSIPRSRSSRTTDPSRSHWANGGNGGVPDIPGVAGGTDASVAGSTDVSIVIVHWNVAHLLAGCLRSVVAEVERSGLTASILVVDSASPDRSYREIVSAYGEVELLALEENRGYAAGCNAGIRCGDSEAVLLLNPDTELLPGSLLTLWETLQIAPHIAMTAPLLLNTDGSIQSAGYRFPGVANVLFDLFPINHRLAESPLNGRVPVGDGVQPIRIDYPLGAVMMLRRSALEEIGLLDESYGMYSEEIDLARSMAGAGWTTLLAPAARVLHHGGQSTGQRPETMHEALWSSRAAYFERFGRPRQRAIIAAIVEAGMRWADRQATPERRETNALIRQRFRQIARRR